MDIGAADAGHLDAHESFSLTEAAGDGVFPDLEGFLVFAEDRCFHPRHATSFVWGP
jgi:hypothetical protein